MKASSVLPSSSIDLRQPQRQCGVGARLHGNEQVGFLADGVLIGVHHNQLAVVVLHGICDVVPGVGPGHDGVVPPNHKGVHLGDKVHVRTALVEEAAGCVHSALGEGEVGGAVLMRELGHVLKAMEIVHIARFGGAVGKAAHTAGPELALVLFDFRADGVDGLIPADALPLAGAALGALHPLHGVLDALLLHDQRGDGSAAGAHALGIDGRSLDVLRTGQHHIAIAHHRLKRAAHASVAVGGAHLLLAVGHGGALVQRRQPCGRAAAGHRQCRSCRRGLQESPAREIPDCVLGKLQNIPLPRFPRPPYRLQARAFEAYCGNGRGETGESPGCQQRSFWFTGKL